MKLKGIHHIAIKIAVGDFPKLVGFYTDILGLEKVRSWEGGVMLSTGDNSLMELMADDSTVTNENGALKHIAFATEDVDGMTEKVRKAGYEIFIEPKDVLIPAEKPYPIRIAFCYGPAGEIIEFFKEY